jgi:hypothetical protein
LISREFYYSVKAPLSIQEVYKKDTITGKRKKHPKNPKTGGNLEIPTKPAHKPLLPISPSKKLIWDLIPI